MLKKVFIVFSLIWMLMIFYMSSLVGELSSEQSGGISQKVYETVINFFNIKQNTEQYENGIKNFDYFIRKFAHFSAFSFLGFLFYGSFYLKENLLSPPFNTDKTAISALIMCVLYSISDELHQFFVPGRACMFIDVLIDISGSILGVFFASLFISLYKVYENKRLKLGKLYILNKKSDTFFSV